MIPGGYGHRAPCTLRLPARRTRLWGEEHCLNVGIAPSPLFHHFRLTDDKLASIFPKSPSGLGRGGVRSEPWDTVTTPSLGSGTTFNNPKSTLRFQSLWFILFCVLSLPGRASPSMLFSTSPKGILLLEGRMEPSEISPREVGKRYQRPSALSGGSDWPRSPHLCPRVGGLLRVLGSGSRIKGTAGFGEGLSLPGQGGVGPPPTTMRGWRLVYLLGTLSKPLPREATLNGHFHQISHGFEG